MTFILNDKQPNEGPRSLVWFMLCFILVLVGMGCADVSSDIPAVSSVQKRQAAVIQANAFVDATVLNRAMAEALLKPKTTPCPKYRGGVVNHHTLAPDLLAQFFVELARCRPDATRIIMLSPDHYQAGQAPYVTHVTPYRTEQDDVMIAASSVRDLLKVAPFGRLDPKPFEREHGIAALIPFMHRVFPNVTIAPLDIEGRITKEHGEYLIGWLKQELEDPATLLVVSSDMSHYLSDEQAWKNDQKTMSAFAQGDSQFFFRVSDDYTDNGKGIWIAMQALRPKTWHILGRKSSTAYGGSVLNTTTYINGLWSSDENQVGN